MEELDDRDRRRPGGDVDGQHAIEPEHGAQAGEDLLVGLGHPRGQLVGHRGAALLEADLLQRGGQARLGDGVLFLGLAGHHDLQAGLQLLPDPRHGEEPRRAGLGQVADDVARVRAAGDLQAEVHGR